MANIIPHISTPYSIPMTQGKMLSAAVCGHTSTGYHGQPPPPPPPPHTLKLCLLLYCQKSVEYSKRESKINGSFSLQLVIVISNCTYNNE